MKIHLIRHTTPRVDQGICYGQTDLELAASFDDEKLVVHSKLDMPYDAVYTSPLQRCYKLATSIESKQFQSDGRLKEYNFGDWEMRPWVDFKSDKADDWMRNFVDQPAPNGDSVLTMQGRVMDFWHDLLKKEHQSVALVTHSGVQRLIHASILETPLTHLFRLQLNFGAVLEVEHHSDSNLSTIRHL